VQDVIDPALARQVERGEYVVDARAVAEAMLRRWRRGDSSVLVAAEPLDGPAVVVEDDEPASLDDLA
jgi:hypothetical protein